MSGTATNPKVLNGNGHTITGLTGASLFANVHNADINNLTIRNCSNLQDVASGEQHGILARRSLNSKFSDLFFDKVSLRGKWRIGFVSGDDGWMGVNGVTAQGSQFRRIQVTNGALTCGQSGYGGFITGWMLNGSMEDVYVQGALAASGPKCGGVVGAVRTSAQLNRCISKVNVSGSAGAKVGVLMGDIEAENYDAANTRVANCVGLGSAAANYWRLAGYTAEGAGSAFQNCYEDAVNKTGRRMRLRMSRLLGAASAQPFAERTASWILTSIDILYCAQGPYMTAWDMMMTCGSSSPLSMRVTRSCGSKGTSRPSLIMT